MTTKKFGREPKEMTTEPSDDELKHEGMKKGGHAHKKHMAMGGNPMMAQAPMKRAMPMRRAMAMQPALLTRKHGGKAHHAEGGESKAMERKEMHEMHKIEKELKHHEGMKASKAHHGLKAGGMYKPQMGGLLGEGKPHHKGMTGGIEGPGYAHGGKAHHVSGHPEGTHKHHMHMAKHHLAKHKEGGSSHHKKMHEHHKHEAKMCMGGKMHKKDGGAAIDRFETKTTLKPKIDINDKVHQAKQTKSFHTKTEGVEGAGYKHGGHLKKFAKGGLATAKEYISKINDGSKMPTKKSGTGEIKEGPAGYKHGGHVAHHSKSKHEHAGHKSMHEHASKHHAHGEHVSHKEHMAHGGKAHKATGGKAKKCDW